MYSLRPERTPILPDRAAVPQMYASGGILSTGIAAICGVAECRRNRHNSVRIAA